MVYQEESSTKVWWSGYHVFEIRHDSLQGVSSVCPFPTKDMLYAQEKNAVRLERWVPLVIIHFPYKPSSELGVPPWPWNPHVWLMEKLRLNSELILNLVGMDHHSSSKFWEQEVPRVFAHHYLYNVPPPVNSYVCWLINPMNTMVIGLINHSY